MVVVGMVELHQLVILQCRELEGGDDDGDVV
jgi:hypothetical protein